MEQDFLKGLNPSQAEAVSYGEGPLLVLAGPGSGKTRVIAHRIAYLIKNNGISPREILAVTFTNKAAREMKKRVETLAGGAALGLWIGTFHSTCLRILRREIDSLSDYAEDFVVYDRADQLALVKRCMKELDYGENLVTAESALGRFDGAENGPEVSFGEGFFAQALENLYLLYKKELVKANAMTFNDLLLVANRLLREDPEVRRRYQERFSHVLVDEYQDTNVPQYRLVKALSDLHKNVFVVGDDSQSIYGWRGADISKIFNFERDFQPPKTVKLEQNYRSTKTVLGIANGIISKNLRRKEKTLWTENPRGEKAVVFRAEDDVEEAAFVAGRISEFADSGDFGFGDAAVFYRANFQSRAVEEALRAAGIPYVVVAGTGFYQRAEIRDMLAYLRLVRNPADAASFARIANVPQRGIGKVTVERVLEVSRTLGLAPLDAVEECEREKLLRSDAVERLGKFSALLGELRREARSGPAGRVVARLLDLTDYVGWLGDDAPRVENVKELLNAASLYGERPLSEFLDDVSLATDQDREGPDGDRVSLMTMHAAKGLEFPAVFLVGLNEGLLPHEKSSETLEEIEEERRLFYVAVTRAEKFLCMSHCSWRRQSGALRHSLPSMFLGEVPAEHVVRETPDEETAPERLPSISLEADPRVAAADSDFSPGQAVSHMHFGRGVVKQVETSGKNVVVTAVFPRYGARKIISDFLSPARKSS